MIAATRGSRTGGVKIGMVIMHDERECKELTRYGIVQRVNGLNETKDTALIKRSKRSHVRPDAFGKLLGSPSGGC